MADVFSTAAAAGAALEQCIRLCSRVRSAVERQKGMLRLIERHVEQLSRTKAIIELVESEEALGTPAVGDAILELVKVGEALETHLSKMDTVKRGRVRGFLEQLASGQRNQQTLERILGDLERTKHDLSMHIQLVNVGLVRGVDRAVQVSAAAVDAVNRQVRKKLGSGHTLRISTVLEGRPRNDDGTVTLTEDDIAFLSLQETVAALPTRPYRANRGETKTSLIVRDNEVSQHALQLNSAVGGMNAPESVASIEIEGNIATTYGIQLNHPIPMHAFMAVVEAMRG